jgi:anti-anti-sigma factor
MEYTASNQNNAMKFALKGQFTFADNSKIRTIIEEVENNKVGSVEFNFSDVDFIDSAGLGMLLLMRDVCQEKQIPIALSNPHGQVEKIFIISKFDQLFTINK